MSTEVMSTELMGTATMRAWRVHELGEPSDVLVLDEVPVPEPGPGQVRVRVTAVAANFPDALLCRGQYQVKPPLPFTPGIEFCGEVDAVGEGVTDRSAGERVVGMPSLPHGAYAENVVVDAQEVYPAPDALDDAESAALFVGYQTAWFALHRRARLAAGETVLVHAAAGGVGSAAVQLAKAAGATVIGVVGGPAKAEVARTLGADVVVDRHTESFVDVVKDVTGGRGVDVVFDPVGGEAYTGSTRCIAFEGRIVVVGFAGGTIPAPPLGHALVKNYAILGLHWGMYRAVDPDAVLACHQELTRMAAAGQVKPLVSERLAIADVPDGVQRVADGATTGRVVFLPA